MLLTDEERSILDGRDGEAKQRAMEVLVMYGEALQAEKMVTVDNVSHTMSCPYPTDRHADQEFSDYDALYSYAVLCAQDGKVYQDIPKVKAFTSTCAANPSPDYLRYLGVTDEKIYKGIELTNAFLKKAGYSNLLTCTPYLVGQLTTLGEHCCMQESSAVIFVNSVLGGRTNCYGEIIAGCAALVGKIPQTGLHCDEERLGTHLVKVECVPKSIYEWDLMGYYMGKKIGAAVPVFEIDIPVITIDMHKSFGSALCTTGAIDMYHVIGHTPEAHTYEQAFGGRVPNAVFTYGEAEREEALAMLDYAKEVNVDMVLLGCPHYSIYQMQQVANLVDGGTCRAKLLVMTTQMIKDQCNRDGYTESIEKAGGFIMTDTCPMMIHYWPEGVKVMSTDSAKCAHYTPSTRPNYSIHMGSMEHCVEAALTGKW